MIPSFFQAIIYGAAEVRARVHSIYSICLHDNLSSLALSFENLVAMIGLVYS